MAKCELCKNVVKEDLKEVQGKMLCQLCASIEEQRAKNRAQALTERKRDDPTCFNPSRQDDRHPGRSRGIGGAHHPSDKLE
jgi:hypothetical protein